VPALRAEIAFGLLKYRSQASTAMYDLVKESRSGLDSSLSPDPRSFVRRSFAYTTVDFGSSGAPAPPRRSPRRVGPV
jgi:hypothetical protein